MRDRHPWSSPRRRSHSVRTKRLSCQRTRFLGDVPAGRRCGPGSQGHGMAVGLSLFHQALQHIVDRDMRRGAEQHPLPALGELEHQLADRRRLSRAGRSLRETRSPASRGPSRRTGVARQFRSDPGPSAPSRPGPQWTPERQAAIWRGRYARIAAATADETMKGSSEAPAERGSGRSICQVLGRSRSSGRSRSGTRSSSSWLVSGCRSITRILRC